MNATTQISSPARFAVRLLLLIGLCFGSATPRASALGADHPPGPVSPSSSWPTGMVALVNIPARVHGYFVNASDTFFYSGDQAAFDKFIQAYARVTNIAAHRIVVHPGTGLARSPWQLPGGSPCDWQLTGMDGAWGPKKTAQPGYVLEVHVWEQGRIRIATNQLPRGFSVVPAKPTP